MDTVVGYDARVIQCLQDYRYSLSITPRPLATCTCVRVTTYVSCTPVNGRSLGHVPG